MARIVFFLMVSEGEKRGEHLSQLRSSFRNDGIDKMWHMSPNNVCHLFRPRKVSLCQERTNKKKTPFPLVSVWRGSSTSATAITYERRFEDRKSKSGSAVWQRWYKEEDFNVFYRVCLSHSFWLQMGSILIHRSEPRAFAERSTLSSELIIEEVEWVSSLAPGNSSGDESFEKSTTCLFFFL